jgi:hypothetical protein
MKYLEKQFAQGIKNIPLGKGQCLSGERHLPKE